MRLDKYLCETGIGTRSEVKKLIKSGKVKVFDRVCDLPKTHIIEGLDRVFVENREISYQKYRYYIFHKPGGCVTAVNDSSHKTVMDYFTEEDARDCFPVGRLDIDTEGLLLITNDGQLGHKLTSPAYHVQKTYYAKLDRPCPDDAIELFRAGVDIGDDKLTLPAKLCILDEPDTARLSITEGRYHQVKRMFEQVGCQVIYLKRESFGYLTLEDILPGQYKEIPGEMIDRYFSDVTKMV